MSQLPDSCRDCKTICCRTGPSPHKAVPVEDYLEVFGTTEAYNLKCENLTRTGKCSIWGTNELPYECRTWVCQARSFSKKELEVIDSISEEECWECEAPYIIKGWLNDDQTLYKAECEVCGAFEEYTVIREGKKV